MKTESRDVRAALADPRAVCQALGLLPSRKDFLLQRGGVTVRCPRHGGLSLSVTLGNDGTIRVKCHGACDLSGDVFTLIAAVDGVELGRDFMAVLRHGAEVAGLWAIVDSIDKKPETSRRENKPKIKPKPVEDNGPPITRERYHKIASDLLHALEWSPRAKAPRAFDADCKKYLQGRGIFAHAVAYGVRGLPSDPALLQQVAEWLRKSFDTDALAAGLLKPTGVFAWPEHVLIIPWRDRDGMITCLQRRRITERPTVDGRHQGPKYVFPRGLAPRVPFGAHLFDQRMTCPWREGSASALLWEPPRVHFVEGALDAIARDKLAFIRNEAIAVLGIPSASAIDATWSSFAEGHDVTIALDADRAGALAGKAIADLVQGAAKSVMHESPFMGKDWGAELEEVLAARG